MLDEGDVTTVAREAHIQISPNIMDSRIETEKGQRHEQDCIEVL